MNTQQTTGVWISAASATILRWGPDGVTVRERIDSLVPGRHRSTGRPPTEEHPAGEGHRDEHMRAFFAQINATVPTDDDLLLVATERSSNTSRIRFRTTIAAEAPLGASRWRRAAP